MTEKAERKRKKNVEEKSESLKKVREKRIFNRRKGISELFFPFFFSLFFPNFEINSVV